MKMHEIITQFKQYIKIPYVYILIAINNERVFNSIPMFNLELCRLL